MVIKGSKPSMWYLLGWQHQDQKEKSKYTSVYHIGMMTEAPSNINTSLPLSGTWHKHCNLSVTAHFHFVNGAVFSLVVTCSVWVTHCADIQQIPRIHLEKCSSPACVFRQHPLLVVALGLLKGPCRRLLFDLYMSNFKYTVCDIWWTHSFNHFPTQMTFFWSQRQLLCDSSVQHYLQSTKQSTEDTELTAVQLRGVTRWTFRIF